jgi:AraC-like DNA-binding protein
MEPGGLLELVLRGAAAGSQIGLGLALARSAVNRSVSIATILFIAANTGFVLNGSGAIRAALGPLTHVLWLVQIGGAGFLWLFALTLFEDRPITPATLAPALALAAIAVVAQAMPQGGAAPLWAAHNIGGLAVAAHAMVIILRSARGDLVEERRRLRVPFMAAISTYSILLSLAQIGQIMGFDAPWYRTVDAGAQALLGILGVIALLKAPEALFGRAHPTAAAPGEPGDQDAAWLARLDAAMREGALWQKEGLTIAELAQNLGLPEHRLRRLINHTLGHRNFPSFVNQHRVEAARAILADPANARRTVASIAFDLGFASLGPFNRAFRDATGLTPTDFRRQALAESSPIPGKSG